MDEILTRFLNKQCADAAVLNQESDLAHIEAIQHASGPAQHFLVRFNCESYVRRDDGQIVKHSGFHVGVYFPDNYLRQANMYEVLTWLDPLNIHHPNIRGNLVCVGERFMRPGTPLLEIIHQLFAVVTYRKWAPHNALNPEASQWAITHQQLFPADRRPLKRRALNLVVAPAQGGVQP